MTLLDKNLSSDYTYCNHNTCIHRRGCTRSLSNYVEVHGHIWIMDGSSCVPDLFDPECTNQYDQLDRFRLSDGSPLPTT